MGIDIDDPDPGDRTGDVTLVFSLGAARRLSDPEAAIANARKWSRHVGIVANDADAVDCPRDGCRERLHAPELGQVGTLGDIHEESGAPGGVRRRVDCEPSRRDPRRSASSTCRSTRRPEKAGWALSEPERSSESG